MQPEGIKRAMMEFYLNLSSETEETEVWRASMEFTSCPKVKEGEKEWLHVLYGDRGVEHYQCVGQYLDRI